MVNSYNNSLPQYQAVSPQASQVPVMSALGLAPVSMMSQPGYEPPAYAYGGGIPYTQPQYVQPSAPVQILNYITFGNTLKLES